MQRVRHGMYGTVHTHTGVTCNIPVIPRSGVFDDTSRESQIGRVSMRAIHQWMATRFTARLSYRTPLLQPPWTNPVQPEAGWWDVDGAYNHVSSSAAQHLPGLQLMSSPLVAFLYAHTKTRFQSRLTRSEVDWFGSFA